MRERLILMGFCMASLVVTVSYSVKLYSFFA